VSGEKQDDEPVFSERAPVAGIEDRESTRFEVDVAVTVDSAHNFYAGYATNLSAGGFFIATHIVHPVGTRFSFTIHLGDQGHIVKGIGEVRWLRAQQSGDAQAGLGIQFLEVEGDGAQRIAKFLEERKPLSAPPPR
jgi:uncharacterized protein (TIGR02266 family)